MYSARVSCLWCMGHVSDSFSLPKNILGGCLGVMQAVKFGLLALTVCCFSQDREFRIQAESTKRIVWDTERRCYLDPAAVLM